MRSGKAAAGHGRASVAIFPRFSGEAWPVLPDANCNNNVYILLLARGWLCRFRRDVKRCATGSRHLSVMTSLAQFAAFEIHVLREIYNMYI